MWGICIHTYTHTPWNSAQSEEWNFAICSNMDGLGGQYAKWNMSETSTVWCHLYMESKNYNKRGGSDSKESACNVGDLGSISGSGEDPLEKGHGTPLQYSCWRIPWTEQPGGLQSIGSQRVGHSWRDLARMQWIKQKEADNRYGEQTSCYQWVEGMGL